jgi:SAM-dependent methyltransferase
MKKSPSSYKDIFETRGALHAEAFRLYPESIAEEAQLIIDAADLTPFETLLDIPSASGFLNRYISTPNINLIAIDPSPQMHKLCRENVPNSHCAALNNIPLENDSVDKVICLAGLHHEPDLLSIFQEIYRVLRIGGQFIIGEVDENSAVSIFLNEFVDQHSSTGHQGIFYSVNYENILRATHFKVTSNLLKNYHWRFDSEDHLADCLIKMFGIDKASPTTVINAVKSILGLDHFADHIRMRWSLRHIISTKELKQ